MKTQTSNPSPPDPLRGGDQLTTRNYQLRAGTINEEQRSVEAVIATEQPVSVFDWRKLDFVDEVLRMDGVKLPDKLPLLDSHNRFGVGAVLGSTREFHIEDGQLVARNYFSQTAQDAWTKVREGHISDNSIGYRVLASTDIKPGETTLIGGRSYTARQRFMRVTTAWELKENSLVPIGADALAKMRAEFTTRQEINIMGTETSTTEIERSESVKTGETTVDAEAIRQDVLKAERQRVTDIRREGESIDETVVHKAIDDGLSVDQARALFLNHWRADRSASVGSPAIHTRDHERDCTREALVAGLLLRAGREIKDAKLAEAGNRYRDLTLLDVCREACRLDGKSIPHGRDELIRAAITTISLPNLFANVANKSMMQGYEEAPNTSLVWCGSKDLPDFKPASRGRLGDVSNLREVNDAGEIEHGEFSEWFENYQLKTYAERLALTRKDMINDDMGALTELPMKMGAAARRLIDDLVYTHLLANGNLNDAIALFQAANHKNYIVGAGTTLQSSQLSIARQMMRKQTDLGGSPINIEPRYLLVPPELEQTALELLNSTEIRDTTANTVRGITNIHYRTLQPIVEPRLSNTNYTGSSTTAWYVLASPLQANTVEIGFLRGLRAPTIERTEMDASVLGMGWRIYFDVAAKALDFRGMFKSKGAA